MNRIKTDDINNDLGILNKITDINKNKRLKWFGHVACKDNTCYANHPYTRTIEITKDPENNHQSDGLTVRRGSFVSLKLPHNSGMTGKIKDKIGALCGCRKILAGVILARGKFVVSEEKCL